MSRHIDADVLVKDLQKRWNVNSDHDFADKEVWRALEEAPSIDIVRCKDCIHFDGFYCNRFGEPAECSSPCSDDGNDFCSFGERKEK